jgi:integrase
VKSGDKLATKSAMPRRYVKLDDRYVSALADFRFDEVGQFVGQTIWDEHVRGLRVRIGRNKVTFSFFCEHRDHGKRGTTCKVLGHWPGMNVVTARKEALVEAGKVASGRITPGKREAVRFDKAFADYLKALGEKAAAKGKPPRWQVTATHLGKTLLPKWGNWTLAEMSGRPDLVKAWHGEITKANGPIAANRCCAIIRAVYRMEARENRTLPPALPTSAVRMNDEQAKGNGIADFPKWAAAWKAIENPVHRAYHLTCLLTGGRPGEIARVTWHDVRPKERALIIRDAKAGHDIRVPLSIEIVRALKIAREHSGSNGVVFPECSQKGRHDNLPARGVALRRTYRTIALDCGIDELVSHFLMGHSPPGISGRYVVKLIASSGKGLREAQRKISRRMMQLLGITLT